MPLGTLAQSDYSAGMFRAVARHLIPTNGVYELANGLLDDDGSVYRRGGSEYLSTGAFGTSLRWIWDGTLGPGPRTLIANPADFGVLDAAEAPINLGGTGLSAPKKAVSLAGVLFIGGGTLYGGSRQTAVYSTGTVSVTNGSKTVTGAGTTWSTLVDAGMLFKISGRYYVVASVDSTTQITLRDAYQGSTAAGQAYSLSPLVTASTPYRVSDIYAVAANRLFSCEGPYARFTAPNSPHAFATNDFHELTGDIVGAAGIRDTLLLFATNGLWLLSGLPFDIVDDAGNPNHRLERVSEDLILLNHEGVANYRGAVVAPCADGVWLLDGVSSPELLSKSIAGLYRAYVAAGYKAGLATTFRSHYFLPIIDSLGAVKDLLFCRLDRPTRTQLGTVFPWGHWGEFSGDLPALAVRTGGSASVRNPALLGASPRPSARVLKLNSCFGPDVGQKNEPDGSTHTWTVDTRDYATGDGMNRNTVRRVKARYELKDAAADDPTLTGFYSDGAFDTSGALWDIGTWDSGTWAGDDSEWVQMAGQAPEDDGRHLFSWPVNRKFRFIRFRLRSRAPTSKLALRTLEMFVRPTGKD